LRRAGEGDVTRDLPYVAVLEVLRVPPLLGVAGAPAPLDQLDLLDQVEIESVLVVDDPVGVGAGDDLAAQLVDLLDREDRHVARSGDEAALPLERVVPGAEHLLDEDGDAVAGRFGPDGGTSPP